MTHPAPLTTEPDENDRIVQHLDSFFADRAAPPTSLTLIGQVTRGDAAAWDRFIELYHGVIERWLQWMHVPFAERDDVRQDVYVTLSKNIPVLQNDQDGCAFRRWLWTVTRSKANDYFRRRKADGQLTMHLEGFEPADMMERSDPPTDHQSDRVIICRAAVERVRRSVDEITWQAFWLSFVEDKKPIEVAQQLDVKHWNVYKARTRVLSRLRKELTGLPMFHSEVADAHPSATDA